MSKYHYKIEVDLTTLKPPAYIGDREEIAQYMFGEIDSTILSLDTNNRLVKGELIMIRSNGNTINLEITKIVRHLVEVSDDNELIEIDMSKPHDQENITKNTTDEIWFLCKANALVLER